MNICVWRIDMSKYVNHKHGLIIGSDNIFFLKDDLNGFRKYKSIVWAQNYEFDDITGVNLMVNTPAQQILWRKSEIDENKHNYLLQSWVDTWLQENVGEMFKDWDYDIIDRHGLLRDKSIFFQKRNDGIKFIKMISNHLDGIKFPK